MARPVRVVHPTGSKVLLWVGALGILFGATAIVAGIVVVDRISDRVESPGDPRWLKARGTPPGRSTTYLEVGVYHVYVVVRPNSARTGSPRVPITEQPLTIPVEVIGPRGKVLGLDEPPQPEAFDTTRHRVVVDFRRFTARHAGVYSLVTGAQVPNLHSPRVESVAIGDPPPPFREGLADFLLLGSLFTAGLGALALGALVLIVGFIWFVAGRRPIDGSPNADPTWQAWQQHRDR